MSTETCTWQWDGQKWDLISGPVGCDPPPIPRDPPGAQTTTFCAGAETDPKCCSDGKCNDDDLTQLS